MIDKKRNFTITNTGENNGLMTGDVYGGITYIQPENTVSTFSLIPSLIEKLAELANVDDEDMERSYKLNPIDLMSYTIEEKIKYNDVIKYKELIREYSLYGSICEQAFNIIDNNNVGIKRKVLRSVSVLYRECKGGILLENRASTQPEMDIIRLNADRILDFVKRDLESRITRNDNLFVEEIDEALMRIICYAFVECKILEKPQVV
ncbi:MULTISPECIES: hypothetical protein [Paenibacillus]|uniref:hypothetical protein n=1 Tax=Paenibacillus TaxID=44249 RepID=UPI0009D6FF56|nr:hypothetical protein [Paenibacillus odorifer]